MTNFFCINARVRIAFSIVLLGLFISFGMFAFAYAQQDDPFASVIYPVAELGGCEDRGACEEYCNDFDNINECIAFAEAHNLFSEDELEHAKKFAEVGTVGPGECTSQATCEAYCEDINHIEECLAFGEEHSLIPQEELEEARKVSRALEGGAVLPGGCTSKDSCELYCNDEAHIEECIVFAEAAGLIPPEELKMARKFIELLKNGETPGGCVGERECEAYCENPDHFDECITFAEKAGFIPPEELEMIKKTGGKGPGDCRGRQECEDYCNDPAHQEACFAFAQEHGLVSDEDLEHVRGGFDRAREGLSQAPPEVRECLRDRVGAEVLAKIESGEQFMPSRDLGEQMRHCFESMGPDPSEFIGDLERAPAPVQECIAEKLGADFKEKLREGGFSGLGVGAGEVIPRCFEQFGGFPGGLGFDGGEHGEFGRGFEDGRFEDRYDTFRDATPAVLGCLSSELSFERYAQLRDGDGGNFTSEDTEVLKRCYDNLGVEQPEGIDVQRRPSESGFVPSSGGGFPPIDFRTGECLAEKLGADFKERMSRGELDRGLIESVMRECITSEFSSQIRDETIHNGQDFDFDRPREDFREPTHRDDFGNDFDRPELRQDDYDVPLLHETQRSTSGFNVSIPPEVAGCVAGKLGGDFQERIANGQLDPSVIEPAIRGCFIERATQDFGRLVPDESGGFPEQYDGSQQAPPDEHLGFPEGEFVPNPDDYPNYPDFPEGENAPPSDGTFDGEHQSDSGERSVIANAWQAFLGIFK